MDWNTKKLKNVQNEDLKAVMEKDQFTYKGRPIPIAQDFSMKTPKARRS